MAPQTSIPTVANVLGTIGTVLWCVQLVPQVWRNYRTKSTEGLPAKWRTTTTTLLLISLIALFAGIQTLLIFLIRPAYHRGTSWPVTLVGVLAALLLISGYIPVPFEILKRRGRVVGIDFGFLTIDCLGAFFSLMAIATQNTVDILGVVMYSLCAAIEAGIFISQGIWLLRTRHIRHRAKEAVTAYEDFPEAQAWQENGFKFKFTVPTCRRKADTREKSSENTSASTSTTNVAGDEQSEAERAVEV
ncbi:MAG: hypothetical protein L6R37_007133 [Teloschistes peruensis]|nr:MAG: hypothetical protein L6R37_007133 [Teloschistes peruensis]